VLAALLVVMAAVGAYLATNLPGVGEFLGGIAATLVLLGLVLRFFWTRVFMPAIRLELRKNGKGNGDPNSAGETLGRIEHKQEAFGRAMIRHLRVDHGHDVTDLEDVL